MSRFFDYFQIGGLLLFLSLLVGRTLFLRFRKGINPITLGVGKKRRRGALELSFPLGLTLWIVEVALYSLNLELRILPSWAHIRLIDSFQAKLAGVALIVISFLLFILALASFGDSWRVGIDKKSPSKLARIYGEEYQDYLSSTGR